MIKLRIGRSEIIYSNEDLMNMNRVQLKQLKQDLQCNIEEVSAKKAKYQAENDEEYNSKEYFKQIAKYKTVIVNLKRAIAKVNAYENFTKENELKDREHWLWCFYTVAKKNLDEDKFSNFVKFTDEKANFSMEIGE